MDLIIKAMLNTNDENQRILTMKYYNSKIYSNKDDNAGLVAIATIPEYVPSYKIRVTTDYLNLKQNSETSESIYKDICNMGLGFIIKDNLLWEKMATLSDMILVTDMYGGKSYDSNDFYFQNAIDFITKYKIDYFDNTKSQESNAYIRK